MALTTTNQATVVVDSSAAAPIESPFPVDPKLLSHVPPARREELLAAYRTKEAFCELSKTWTDDGSPDRLAPYALEMWIKSPSANGTESPAREEMVTTAELEFKARMGCAVPATTTAWFVTSNGSVQQRKTDTSVVEQTLSEVKVGCTPTAIAYVSNPAPNTSSPARRTEPCEPCLGGGDMIYVGFNDGCVKVFPADPLAAVKAHKAAYGTLDPYTAIDLPKVHTASITSIVASPARAPPKGYKNDFTIAERCRQLVCVAGIDSVIAVWDAAIINDTAASHHHRQMKLQQALRQGVAPTTIGAKHQPFFVGVRDAVPLADNRAQADVTRCFSISIDVRPLMRLKGNVAGIRTLCWAHTTVVEKLPAGFGISNASSPLPVKRTPAPTADDLREMVRDGNLTEDSVLNWDPSTTVQTDNIETKVTAPGEISNTAAAGSNAEPTQCREVDLLVSGDDEGRFTLWNLQDELRTAEMQIARSKADTEAASSASFRGSMLSSRSSSVRSTQMRSASVMGCNPTSKPFVVSRAVSVASVSSLTASKFGTTHVVQPRQSANVLEFCNSSAIIGLACDLPPFVELGARTTPPEEGNDAENKSAIFDATEAEVLAAAVNRLRCFIVFADASTVFVAARAVPRDAPLQAMEIGAHALEAVPGRFHMATTFDVTWCQIGFHRRHVAATSTYHDAANRSVIVTASSGAIDVWDLSKVAVVAVVPQFQAEHVPGLLELGITSRVLRPHEAAAPLNAVYEAHHDTPTAGSSHLPFVQSHVEVGRAQFQGVQAFTGVDGALSEASIASDCPTPMEPMVTHHVDELQKRVEKVRKVCESTASELVAERQYAYAQTLEVEARSWAAVTAADHLGHLTYASTMFNHWAAAAREKRRQRLNRLNAESIAQRVQRDTEQKQQHRARFAEARAAILRFKKLASDNVFNYCIADSLYTQTMKKWIQWAATRRLERREAKISHAVDVAVSRFGTLWHWEMKTALIQKARDEAKILGEQWIAATLSKARDDLTVPLEHQHLVDCTLEKSLRDVASIHEESQFCVDLRFVTNESSWMSLAKRYVLDLLVKPAVFRRYPDWLTQVPEEGVEDASAAAPLPNVTEAREQVLDALTAVRTLVTHPHIPLNDANSAFANSVRAFFMTVEALEAATEKRNAAAQAHAEAAEKQSAEDARVEEAKKTAEALREAQEKASAATAEKEAAVQTQRTKLEELRRDLAAAEEERDRPIPEGQPAPEEDNVSALNSKIARLKFQAADQEQVISAAEAELKKAAQAWEQAEAEHDAALKLCTPNEVIRANLDEAKANLDAVTAAHDEVVATHDAKKQTMEQDKRNVLDANLSVSRWISAGADESKLFEALKAVVVAVDKLAAVEDRDLVEAKDPNDYPYAATEAETLFLNDVRWQDWVFNADLIAQITNGRPSTIEQLRADELLQGQEESQQ